MASPKNLLDLSVAEKRDFIDSFDYVLTDCDGTVWMYNGPIKGNDAGIKALQDSGKKVLFISNNSVRTDESYMGKFKESNINAKIDDVIHPARATVQYLKNINFQGLIYCIGSTQFKKVLKEGGYNYVDGPNHQLEDSFPVLLKAIKDDLPVDAVIMDTDFNLSISKILRAEIYLKNPKCLFIVGTTDMMLPITPKLQLIGPGPFYKVIENSMFGRQPTIVGKPGNALTEVVIQMLGITNPKRVLFVGDMFEQDIRFGNESNFQTLLLLTGGATKQNLLKHKITEELPNYYANSYADFVQIFDELKNNPNTKLNKLINY